MTMYDPRMGKITPTSSNLPGEKDFLGEEFLDPAGDEPAEVVASCGKRDGGTLLAHEGDSLPLYSEFTGKVSAAPSAAKLFSEEKIKNTAKRKMVNPKVII